MYGLHSNIPETNLEAGTMKSYLSHAIIAIAEYSLPLGDAYGLVVPVELAIKDCGHRYVQGFFRQAHGITTVGWRERGSVLPSGYFETSETEWELCSHMTGLSWHVDGVHAPLSRFAHQFCRAVDPNSPPEIHSVEARIFPGLRKIRVASVSVLPHRKLRTVCA